MKKLKVYYFPPEDRKNGYKNPYSINFLESIKPYFRIVNKRSQIYKILPKGLNLAFMSCSANIYIISWLESICFGKIALLQFISSIIALNILKIRKVKIIWIYHNIHPHQGNNRLSKAIQTFLFNNSSLIISHSIEASNYAKKFAKCPVIYKCHPIKKIETKKYNNIIDHDIFIWGSILPYKGILEFIIEHRKRQSQLTVYILGKCNDITLSKSINEACNQYIIYENRIADFSEIASNIQKSKFILFPYIGDCISSSGALIDTIAMNGIPVGPNKGAFIDLAKENLCITYNNYNELFKILSENKLVNHNNNKSFIENNSWEKFGTFLQESIKNL